MTNSPTQTRREHTAALLRRMLAHLNNGSSDEAASQMTEDASIFTDQALWQRERQQFFLDTPQVAGFAGELADKGSVKFTTIMGRPLVITRGEDGILRAFINACAHRGSELTLAKSGKRLSCPFHGWSYQFDGKLAGRPQADAFDPADASLNLLPLPVSDRAGLIVVGLHGGVAQETVDHFLDPIADSLASLGFDRMQQVAVAHYEVAAHWKLITSLSHESYHFNVLHRDSLSPIMSHHTVADFYGIHSRWAFPFKGCEDLAKQNEADWPEYFPGVVNHTIFPGTVIVMNPEDAQIIRVEPGNHPGSARVEFAGACTDPARADSSKEAWSFGESIFVGEDLRAAESCQRGIDAGLTQVLAGRNEPVVQFWHTLWREKLLPQ